MVQDCNPDADTEEVRKRPDDTSIDPIVSGTFREIEPNARSIATVQETEGFSQLMGYLFGEHRYDNGPELRLIGFSLAYALIAHRFHKRKLGGYEVVHPIESARYVVEIEGDALSIGIALVHDTIERIGGDLVANRLKETPRPVNDRAGVEEIVFQECHSRLLVRFEPYIPVAQYQLFGESLSQISKMPSVDYLSYAYRLENPRAMIAKLADRANNIQTMDSEQGFLQSINGLMSALKICYGWQELRIYIIH